jgi:hypothetical protein
MPAQPQIKELRLEVSDGPKKAQDGKAQAGNNAKKPPDTTLQTVLKDSGMKNVGNPPSEADLKTYYSKNAPEHDLIANGSYDKAAEEYRKLAAKATDNPAEQERLTKVKEQLDVAQEMKKANVQSLEFPPSEKNVTEYFNTMKGKPIIEIKAAFQSYAEAFYVHEGDVGGEDITYSKHKHQGKDSYAPESWKEVTDNRDVHSDGRRIIDCEGYAYMGQKMLKAAGFDVNFGVAARNDNLNRAHIMVSGSRTITDPVDGKQKTEMAVISNNDFFSKSADGILKPSADPIRNPGDFETFQNDLFHDEMQRDKRPSGPYPIEIGPDAWREEFKLQDLINARQQAHPPAAPPPSPPR